MKKGLAVAIHDVKREGHIEMLTLIFDNQESVDIYTERRLNPLTTIVVSVSEVSVPKEYNLFSWTREELNESLRVEKERSEKLLENRKIRSNKRRNV